MKPHFLTGIERNSDLVPMASYAPLFENRNDRKWPVNLIWLDSDKVVGRSSYYVQKMFSENRPTFNVPLTAESLRPQANDKRHFFAAGYKEDTKEIIVKIVNATDRPFVASFKLDNAGVIQEQGKVITLSASTLGDENSFEEPFKILPKEEVCVGFQAALRINLSLLHSLFLKLKASNSVLVHGNFALKNMYETNSRSRNAFVWGFRSFWPHHKLRTHGIYGPSHRDENDGLHLAVSSDGLNWKAVKDDTSIFKPSQWIFRDPAIQRDSSGSYHLLWTVAWNARQIKAIGYAKSKDLVHWEKERFLPVMENEPETQYVWGPELFWDNKYKDWIITWGSTVRGSFPRPHTSTETR